MSLQQFDFEIQHREGKKHLNADALSRNPRHQQSDSCPTCRINAIIPEHNSNTRVDLREAQELDHDLQIIRVSLTEDRPMSHDEKNELSTYGLEILKQGSLLSVRSGHVMIYKKNRWVVIAPQDTTRTLLEELHSGLGGGHFGVTKLITKVEERFWWPHHKDDITSFVAGCPTCSRCKDPPRTQRAELYPIVTSRPNQIVAVDVIGRLTQTRHGNKYILVLTDLYTKWAEVAPMGDQTSESTMKEIMHCWISRYGVPERLHSDQGPNFFSFRPNSKNSAERSICNTLPPRPTIQRAMGKLSV